VFCHVFSTIEKEIGLICV